MISSDNDLGKVGPEPASTYYDKRLAKLNIEFWTTIRVASHYAASAISLYLETDHPVFGLFDAELFITDLIACKFKYCSPFLVSSLLAFASVCSINTPPFWRFINIVIASLYVEGLYCCREKQGV
jgi:hypothetical protein